MGKDTDKPAVASLADLQAQLAALTERVAHLEAAPASATEPPPPPTPDERRRAKRAKFAARLEQATAAKDDGLIAYFTRKLQILDQE